MKLIDADAFIEEARNRIDMQDEYLPIHIKYFVIDKMPTINAEPIVRCKDCKFNYANQIPSGDGCQLCVEVPISKDFFCAYGERMDEDENN